MPTGYGEGEVLVGRRKRDDERVRRYLPVPVVSRSNVRALVGACLADGCDLVIHARPTRG